MQAAVNDGKSIPSVNKIFTFLMVSRMAASLSGQKTGGSQYHNRLLFDETLSRDLRQDFGQHINFCVAPDSEMF